MTMPVEQDINGQPIARPQLLTVTWQGGMAFQANTVVFRKAVEAQSGHQSLNTEKLAAVLDRPIDFSNPARLNSHATRGPAATGPRPLLRARRFSRAGNSTSAASKPPST